MSRRNRERESRVKGRGSRARLRGRAPRDRRGVLLLVVLSLLVLFMLIGTAFLMSSNQYKTSADASAKNGRVGNYPTVLLDRALMQALCDTGNVNSVIRNHSLLRDIYGSEGFEAVVYSPLDSYLNVTNFPATAPRAQLSRFAMPTNGAAMNPPLGPTQGQLIDIYFRELAYKSDDPLTPGPLNEGQTGGAYELTAPDARHVLKLERSVAGLPEMYNLPLTKGYFNGCLLTITSGPAAGQSTRIVDYQYIADLPTLPLQTSDPFPTKSVSRLFRLRVMAFPNAAGNPLLTRGQLPVDDSRRTTNSARQLEIADLVTDETRNAANAITATSGATFIVNGRPFSGTGVGFNELAKSGEPRLDAVEAVGVSSDPEHWLFPEIALTPNSAYFFNADPAPTSANQDMWGARYLVPSPAGPLYPPLNPTANSIVPTTPINLRPLRWKYPTFSGPGDADESYDAADSQNMFLALQTVTPRARARVVHGQPDTPISYEIDSSEVIDNQGNYANTDRFLRLDLEDLPWPSFHRPDLQNYWFHRLMNYAIAADSASPDDAVRAVLTPYGPDARRDAPGISNDDPSVSVDVRDTIVAIKRKISLRPIREDHPGFDGSNPASRIPRLDDSTGLTRNGNIAIPFWEATGPWDVDNDNDGVAESVWVDLGDPVQQAEDGTLYKPLYAFLIVDLDSRLNVNAHGLVDHLRSPQLDSKIDLATGAGFGNLAHDIPLAASGAPTLYSSNFLPSGSGYGPAEISLRPLFSPNLPGNTDTVLAARFGNPAFDDYARILAGRPALGQQPSVWGRHGSVDIRGSVAGWTLTEWGNNLLASREAIKVRPGIPYDVTNAVTQANTLDRLTAFKFFGYPLWLSNYFGMVPMPSSFSQVPDLLGRYAIGLDYSGQPASEPYGDSLYTVFSGDPDLSLLYDTPYELDLSDSQRRDTPDAAVASAISVSKTAALNDDAPFATADLEHILRAHDADSGILPDRLWSVVDAFDPLKLRDDQPQLVDAAALSTFGTAGRDERLAAAQQLAEVSRRLVTTDSYDVPVPTNNFLKRLIYGADGQPGVAGVDDESEGDAIDDVGNPMDPNDKSELGWYNSDDWYAVMYHQPTPENPTPFSAAGAPTPATGVRLEPQNPTIVDLLRYRIQYERRKRGVPLYNETELTAVTQQLLAPEILAGGRMDLNRPFGDGRDNGDGIDNDGNSLVDEPNEPGDALLNGIVDDPLEAGEPFIDSRTGPNNNGKRDPGEYFYNFIGGSGELSNTDADYNGPRDSLWQGLANEPVGFSYNHGGVTTDGKLIDLNDDGDVNDVGEGRLRYNGIIQRQTHARQLYCLMMLLVDENYIASQNVAANAEGNINLQFFFRELWSQVAYELAKERGRAPVAPDQVPTPIQQDYTDAQPIAERLALRKLTARRIAQWAINAVDFRDADAEMTPFEYDDNPFDGWGLYVPDIADPTDPPLFVPIDGDPGTNENWGGVKPFQIYPTKYDRTAAVNNSTNADDDANADNATRGVVWGAERPELLITETLAFHDRRCTDEAFPNNSTINPPGNPPDYDLDQRLKPRGALYLELYNPWSDDSGHSVELYGRDNGSPNPKQGVMLNRLSSLGVATTVGPKRSPVWRVAVVQDPVNGRLTNQIIDISALTAPAGADDRQALASQFLTTDASGFGFDSDQDAERLIYFTTGRDYTTGFGSDPDRSNDNIFDTEYLSLPNHQADPNCPNLNVWVPPLPYRERTGKPPIRTGKRFFIARTERNPSVPNDSDVPIAPILPGRYAVVGPSGLQLDVAGAPIAYAGVGPRPAAPGDRYVMPLSRLQEAAGGLPDQAPDSNHNDPKALAMTRRIELWPSVDPDSPTVPNTARPSQVLVEENGGPEIVSNRNGAFVNVTDANNDKIPDATIVDTPVAIPVEDLNISEPVEAYRASSAEFRDGYPTERYIEMSGNPALNPAGGGVPAAYVEPRLSADGELVYDPPYDRPLDMEAELIRNGTTQNYRSIHLQRLANPMFPWNPPRFDDKGRPNDMHRANLPVNPYVTVDSQGTDLTAFNGASYVERANLPAKPSTPDPNDPNTPADDFMQGDYFAPLSAAEYIQAPDHVLAGLISVLASEDPPIVDPWRSVEEYRGTGSPADISRIANDLDELETRREGDTAGRAELKRATEWGWHRIRRTLPDDLEIGYPGIYAESQFKQRLNFKSLERGAHYQAYYKYPQPGSPEGWWFDTSWTPRLLWKQERPNTMLFLRGAGGATVRVTDMKNSRSWRQLRGTLEGTLRPEDFYTQDDDRKAQQYFSVNIQMPKHVLNFALEHTLGFVNESYSPDLDRTGNDKNAMLMSDANPANQDPKPGAPEVATDPTSLATPQAEELNRWNTLTPQQVLIQPAEELQRRQRLMKSTFPWFTWNNRPFTSADELTQVSASSPSLMLREYSVASRNTANPYDGDGMNNGPPAALETVNERLARQQGAFGHLLNFFQAADKPAGTYTTAPGAPLEPLTGGPNYYRLLDYVEVPSKFVGTDTLLSPEIFNDNPLVASSPANPAEDITSLEDPRLLLQPPFNKISRQRDPGRVNLNTVTGRRLPPQPNNTYASGFSPAHIWSEVYDGIMHRYGDNNLLSNPGAVAPNVLELGHFGPAWRDVVLSRRGYAQFNADAATPPPLDALGGVPDAFMGGLNRDFPSIFSNPFRSADAGDLVPLSQMVRTGVDATLLRGQHWLRADDDFLHSNPYASVTGKFNRIAWGEAGVDDDRNGLVDDMREAGFGDPTKDSDPIYLQEGPIKALKGSGIPLFSEEVPEPAIDGERNPGMMYQPMTRLGNLVTTRSNVYAIWVTVGYFEVEKAPDWNDPNTTVQRNVRARFGATTNSNDPETIRGRALYDRIYPDGYTLGEELGTDTGSTNRHRAFYIIDRTEPVGFKPGEALNVDKMIRVRRRIE